MFWTCWLSNDDTFGKMATDQVQGVEVKVVNSDKVGILYLTPIWLEVFAIVHLSTQTSLHSLSYIEPL